MEQSPGSLHYGVIGLFFLALTLSVFLFASGPRVEGGKVVVFVTPWSASLKAIEVISKADGAFVGMGTMPWIAIASSSQSDFADRLYQSGAIYVGSAEVFSACIPAQTAYQLTQKQTSSHNRHASATSAAMQATTNKKPILT